MTSLTPIRTKISSHSYTYWLLGVIVLVMSVVLVGLFSPITQAESGMIGGQPAHPDPANSRTKSIFIKTIPPGTSVSDVVKVVNNSTETKSVQVYSTDATTSSGGAFACTQAADPIKGVGGWIALRKEVSVAAHSSIDVPFTITAPPRAEPGEQNGCIILQEKKEPNFQSGIALSFRTGVRVAVLIPGEIHKNISPLALNVKQSNEKVILTPSVKNSGNVSIDTDVKTTIKSVFGHIISSQTSTYPVLRDQVTEWNFEMPQLFWGGFYRGSYTLSYDTSNRFIDSATTKQLKTVEGQRVWFFALPSIGAFLIELAILLIIIGSIFSYRQYLLHKFAIEKTWASYTVKPSDNLQIIAKKHAINWRILARANNFKPPYSLSVGTTIKVPGKDKSSVKPHTRKK